MNGDIEIGDCYAEDGSCFALNPLNIVTIVSKLNNDYYKTFYMPDNRLVVVSARYLKKFCTKVN